MTKFWPIKCEWGCHVQVPNHDQKGREYALCFPFLFSFSLTSKIHIVPQDGSCLLKMKGQRNKRSLNIWYLWNYHASRTEFLGFHMKEKKFLFDQATVIFVLCYRAEPVFKLLYLFTPIMIQYSSSLSTYIYMHIHICRERERHIYI